VVLIVSSVPDEGGVVKVAAKPCFFTGPERASRREGRRRWCRSTTSGWSVGRLKRSTRRAISSSRRSSCTPEFVDHEPAHGEQPTGPESVQQTVRRLQGAFGELRFEVEDEIAEGDKVVQLVIMNGRHTRPLMGREPTGKAFAVRHIYIWRIADDKIVEHWGSRDDLGLLGQLGLLPIGEESGAG